jgi:teichuronic acid biosynthesis glycosyltransferase TuaG
MPTNPYVSVVMPFKDRHDYAVESCMSVLAQEFSDFELILVDDGSQTPFNAPDILADPRVRYFKQPNKGASAARNKGIQEARGKYIAFLDSDDLFHPTKLKIQIEAMKKSEGFVLSHTSYYRFKKTIHSELTLIDTSRISGHAFPRIVASCPMATPCVVVLTDVIRNYLFDEDLHVMEDFIVWTRIAEKHPILHVEMPLSYIRIHDSNAAFDYSNRLAQTKTALKRLAHYSVHIPVPTRYLRLIKSFLLNYLNKI